MVRISKPWSAKHKRVTKGGSLPYNLSNSFAQPLTSEELIQYAKERGDQDLLDAYQKHDLTYTPNGGSLDLRQEIAQLYGPSITANHILVFTGGQVAVQTAAFAVCDHDNSHAIVFTPGYQSLLVGPVHAGAQVTQIQLSAANGWAIDVKQVEAAIQENTKYIVINEPYNPAGTLMARQTQQELIDLAAKHNIIIFCDEVYRLLEHNPEKDRLAAMCDAYQKGMSCVTMSKPWGACGVSIGWIACQDLDLKERMTQVQYFGTACPSRASELQAIMVLRASDFILGKNLQIIRHNVQLLREFMDRHKDLFHWVPPNAGAIAFIKLKAGKLMSDELGAQLAEHGIGIKPAYCFSGDENVTEQVDYFRVGYGESKFPTALSQFEEYVVQHRDQWLLAQESAST
ncbi:Kynurenine--oxoglutarate transaminase 1 [Seminavis robusta]|uniref:Kynurenine--oxoglutarate transaminase 1 n=1 Tax=Seminavis robusta TaxID=568900 RepID=A0A9N8EM74_9STRA|nr:Kynurenine--oxoglutarate transaminase 1 [Seminavis robusta]|eukprot:Sro1455_g274110.1 Kynurenine--oxoglutarate transaminase 1 (400) ;mRNA; f:3711-4910